MNKKKSQVSQVLAGLSGILLLFFSHPCLHGFHFQHFHRKIFSHTTQEKKKKKAERNLRVEVDTAEGLTDVAKGFEALKRHGSGREQGGTRADLALGLVRLMDRGDGHLFIILFTRRNRKRETDVLGYKVDP